MSTLVKTVQKFYRIQRPTPPEALLPLSSSSHQGINSSSSSVQIRAELQPEPRLSSSSNQVINSSSSSVQISAEPQPAEPRQTLTPKQRKLENKAFKRNFKDCRMGFGDWKNTSCRGGGLVGPVKVIEAL